MSGIIMGDSLPENKKYYIIRDEHIFVIYYIATGKTHKLYPNFQTGLSEHINNGADPNQVRKISWHSVTC
jgi:hypothetical protein